MYTMHISVQGTSTSRASPKPNHQHSWVTKENQESSRHPKTHTRYRYKWLWGRGKHAMLLVANISGETKSWESITWSTCYFWLPKQIWTEKGEERGASSEDEQDMEQHGDLKHAHYTFHTLRDLSDIWMSPMGITKVFSSRILKDKLIEILDVFCWKKNMCVGSEWNYSEYHALGATFVCVIHPYVRTQ